MQVTKTETLISALKILANDIQSDDGVANACISEAADRLEELNTKLTFLYSLFHSHSLKMDGRHSWRFSTAWPWNHARGLSIDVAVEAAIAELKREQQNATS